MNAFSLVSVWACVSLTSCVSFYSLPKDYAGPTAVIRSTSESVSSVKGKGYYVSEIDGKVVRNGSPMATPYGAGMGVTLRESETRLPTQPVTLTLVGGTIYAADGVALADNLAGGFRHVSGKVTFTPKANGQYRVKGILEPKGSESVWLVDDKTGKMVGGKITKQ